METLGGETLTLPCSRRQGRSEGSITSWARSCVLPAGPQPGRAGELTAQTRSSDLSLDQTQATPASFRDSMLSRKWLGMFLAFPQGCCLMVTLQLPQLQASRLCAGQGETGRSH